MVKYVVKRIVLMFITLFIIMTICFVMIKLLPDPIIKSKLAEYKQELALREAWGYNKPILTQYGIFLKKSIYRMEPGLLHQSRTKFMDVTEYIAMKLPATIAVNLYSVIISVPLGILFGIYAALKKNKWQDQVINVIIMIFISVPSYVYAFLVQYFIGYKLGWFPIVIKTGTDYFSWDMFVHGLADNGAFIWYNCRADALYPCGADGNAYKRLYASCSRKRVDKDAGNGASCTAQCFCTDSSDGNWLFR